MDLHLFFDGKRNKEETASAFLGTLLAHRADFREIFFWEAGVDWLEGVAAPGWDAKLDHHDVDVYLTSPDRNAVVLIEHKLFPGPMRAGQKYLSGYYHRQIEREPTPRVIAIHLAPREGFGRGEVKSVLDSPRFRDRASDHAAHLVWSALAEYVSSVPPGDGDLWFIRSGFESILEVIDAADVTQFPIVGERAAIKQVIEQAVRRLAPQYPNVRFKPWVSHREHTILVSSAGLTFWLALGFEAQPRPPFLPVGTQIKGQFKLLLRTQFKQSQTARKDRPRRQRWEALSSEGHIEVPSVGLHYAKPRGWFEHEVTITGTEAETIDRVVASGQAILNSLVEYL